MHRAAAIACRSCTPLLAGIAITLASNAPAQTPTQFVVRTPTAMATAMLTEAAIADFDGDGDLDVCGGTSLFSPIRQLLLRNDGAERFTDVTATHLPVATTTTYATVPFDMDGDGDLDLFVSKLGASRLWRNTGLSVFVDASAGLPAAAQNHLRVVAADFDGDGDVDLAAAGNSLNSSQNRLLVNNGGGTFTAIDPFPGNSSLAITAVDFDGDGDQDLAVGMSFGVSLYRNDGNLVFTDVSALWLPALGTSITRDVAAGDLDGDGDLDLVVTRHNAGADPVLRNTGSAFVLAAPLSFAGGNTNAFALADVDDDGDLDIARSVIGAPLALDINDGTGTFAAAPSRLPVVTSNAGVLLTADFDRDGDRDLLLCAPFVPPSLLVNRHRDLQTGPAILGQAWTIDVWSAPGYATLDHLSRLAIGLARLPQPLPIPGFGLLWIDLGAPYLATDGIVFASTGRHQFTFLVPALPQLAGIELHLQALVEQARAPARFTAYRSIVVQ